MAPPQKVVNPVEFELHSDFASKIFVADLPLSRVLLQNERHYPWIILVPRRQGMSRIMQLHPEDQLQLLQELDLAQTLLWDTFKPTQLNVAAIGNKTPQLHVHVIARFAHDPAWPGTVWDHPTRAKYAPEELENVLGKLKRDISGITQNQMVKSSNPLIPPLLT
jgi:diadenosine tetraphosphate (Ap4A) HIT family hydrolase